MEETKVVRTNNPVAVAYIQRKTRIPNIAKPKDAVLSLEAKLHCRRKHAQPSPPGSLTRKSESQLLQEALEELQESLADARPRHRWWRSVSRMRNVNNGILVCRRCVNDTERFLAAEQGAASSKGTTGSAENSTTKSHKSQKQRQTKMYSINEKEQVGAAIARSAGAPAAAASQPLPLQFKYSCCKACLWWDWHALLRRHQDPFYVYQKMFDEQDKIEEQAKQKTAFAAAGAITNATSAGKQTTAASTAATLSSATATEAATTTTSPPLAPQAPFCRVIVKGIRGNNSTRRLPVPLAK